MPTASYFIFYRNKKGVYFLRRNARHSHLYTSLNYMALVTALHKWNDGHAVAVWCPTMA